MTAAPRFARTALCLLAALAVAPPVAGAQEGDLTANVLVDGSEGGSTMTVMLGGEDRVRMDMNASQGEVSIVMKPESMMMIMHSQRMYLEFPKAMLEQMQQMLGGAGRRQMAEVEEFDPSSVTFEPTGNTDTINGTDAFEVAVHSNDGKTSHIWLTDDLEVGLFEVFARLLGPLSSMSLPGMQGGDNPMAKMQAVMQVARANGLPAGKVIRVVTDDSAMTLGETSTDALAASTWNPPDGYQKQSMPMMRQ